MKKLHVAPSPLTNRIYCGHVLKDGLTWGANKQDVTGEACAAVAKHALHNDGPLVVTKNGVPAYEITVRELTPNASLGGTATKGENDDVERRSRGRNRLGRLGAKQGREIGRGKTGCA